MDKTIRRNEICVIGLPRCDFAFSSTRTCFIAYGFEESTLEMTILRSLLESRGIQPIEAGGSFAPGQNTFCAKICSKIITSQFCIVLLNNDEQNGNEIPNANVNMEYGLMLGFNKYVIPFQRESQKLPFNVAGLDTIKYTNRDLEPQAIKAIEQAISATNQDEIPMGTSDQNLQIFLLSKNMLISSVDNEGERNIYNLGEPLGFNLLNDFPGLQYAYLGRFSSLRRESVLWRIRKMNEIINGRRSSIDTKLTLGMCTPEQAAAATALFETMQLWVIVTSDQDKEVVESDLQRQKIDYPVNIISIADISSQLETFGGESWERP